MVRDYVVAYRFESGEVKVLNVRASTSRIAQSKADKQAVNEFEAQPLESRVMTDTAYSKLHQSGSPIFEMAPAPEEASSDDQANEAPVSDEAPAAQVAESADEAPEVQVAEAKIRGRRPVTETRVDSLTVIDGPGLASYVISDYIEGGHKILVTDTGYCLTSLEASKISDDTYIVSYIKIPVDNRRSTEALARLLHGVREFAEVRGIQVLLSDPGKFGAFAWGTVRDTAAESGFEKVPTKRGILTAGAWCDFTDELTKGTTGQAELRKFIYKVNGD